MGESKERRNGPDATFQLQCAKTKSDQRPNSLPALTGRPTTSGTPHYFMGRLGVAALQGAYQTLYAYLYHIQGPERLQ